METHEINNQISFEDISAIIKQKKQLKLSVLAKKKIATCREYLDKKMDGNDKAIYGINTGFGSLCNTKISDSD